jgi:predicted nucleotidyltransferase
MKLENVLRGIVELIVRCCDPEEVLLFGSYAKQQDTLDSDLDILVVGDFRESRYQRGREVRALMQRYPIRVDLHFVTSEEVSAESRKPFGFISSVLTSGRILYKKSEKGIDSICGRRYS